MNIKYINTDSDYNGSLPTLTSGSGGVWGSWGESEARRRMIEKEVEQKFGPDPDSIEWIEISESAKHKSGGIISAIKAIFRRRRESKNLEKTGEEKPDNSGPFIKP